MIAARIAAPTISNLRFVPKSAFGLCDKDGEADGQKVCTPVLLEGEESGYGETDGVGDGEDELAGLGVATGESVGSTIGDGVRVMIGDGVGVLTIEVG